jgi:hypothetical protein
MDTASSGPGAPVVVEALEALRGREIVVRPRRLPLAFASVVLVVGVVYGAYHGAAAGFGTLGYAHIAIILVIAVLLLVYYAFFCIMTIDETSITQLRYFGLVHKRILIRDLIAVRARIFEGWRINRPGVRFCTARDEIVLLAPDWTEELQTAITLIREAGVPVDRLVIAALDP